jgi:peptide/nickel transport system substrate-binding protein
MAETVPEASRDALPDHALEVYNPAFVHSGFILNHNRGPLADRRARKALAYVLDREQIAGNMSQSFPANSDIVGFSHSYDQFLGADFVENQIEHYDADTEKAAQLLRDAGLEKSGGTWMWEGEPWQPSIYSHGFADFVTMGRTGSSVLQEFGIQAEYSQIEFSALATRMTEVDFDMAIFFSGRGVWPQVPFSNDLTGATWGMDNYAGSPANDKTLEVPPVGELGGSMETYDAAGKTTELAQATGEDELQELRRELAWVYNQTLPAIQIAPRNIGHTLSTDDWNVAEDDVRLGFLNPAVWVPSQGGMTPKYQ